MAAETKAMASPRFFLTFCFVHFRLHGAERAEGIHQPGRLIIDATRIRPMGYAPHAGAAGRPKSHECVKRLRHREAWVFRPLFAGNQPGAAIIWPYAAVECAGVSGDGEGASEFPTAA